VERFHRAQCQVLRPIKCSVLSLVPRLLDESLDGIKGARPFEGARLRVSSGCLSRVPPVLMTLVGVPEYLRVDSKVGLHRGQDLQVIVFVHLQYEDLMCVLLVIVNLEPVGLGLSKSDRALRGVLVGKLVDLGIWDRHRVALGRAYFNCPVVIAESKDRLNVLPLWIWHTDAVERGLVGKADRRSCQG
jgi:hypothetical protein